MIELYHGSYTAIDKPLADVGRTELDFGPGFYLTRFREQAERWAKRVCVIRNVATPCISVYDFDEQALGQLKYAKPTPRYVFAHKA